MKKIKNKLLLVGSILSSTALFAISAACSNTKKEEKPSKPSNPSNGTESGSTTNPGETQPSTPEQPGTTPTEPENPSTGTETGSTTNPGETQPNKPETTTPEQPENPSTGTENGSTTNPGETKPSTPEQPKNPSTGTENGNTTNPSETQPTQPEKPEVTNPEQPKNPSTGTENGNTTNPDVAQPTQPETTETNQQKSTVLNYIYNNQAIYTLTFMMSENDVVNFDNVPKGYELVEANPKVIAGQTNNFQVVKTKVTLKTLRKSPSVNTVTSDDTYLGLSYSKNRNETLAFVNQSVNPVNNRSLTENDRLLISKLTDARAQLLRDYFVTNTDDLGNVSNLTFITKLRDDSQKVNRYNLSSYIFTIDLLLSDEKYLTNENVELVLGNKEKVAAMNDFQVQFSSDSNVEIFNRKMKIAGIK